MMKSIEKLRELAADINSTEILDHMEVSGKFLFHAEWLHSWHSEFDRLCDEIEREIAERYMELPVDMDGVPIRLGDEIQQINHAGEWTNALPVIAVDENGCFAAVQALTCEARTYVWGNNCRHVKPRTVEDVLRDYACDFSESSGPDYDEEITRRYADEIRELMGVSE